MTDNTETRDPLMMVKEFQIKFETPETKDFWTKLILEESREVMEAAEHLLKEISDLVYVASGYTNVGGNPDALTGNPEVNAAVQWVNNMVELVGADKSFEAFKRVHESNLSKLGDDGKPIRREDGKVLKGPNYKPPVLGDLVR